MGDILSRTWLALKSRFAPDISIFHQFVKPPYGGGNQFALALKKELENRGYAVGANRITTSTLSCLFNSYNFDYEKLARLKDKHPDCKMTHRVDGPITVYRSVDDGTDKKIHEMNTNLADVTVFQSNYSFSRHKELGLNFVNPVVIVNACDPSIFHSRGRVPFDPAHKIKLISVAWSDNVNKGGPVYQWLEKHLDWNRYEFTFVGRTKYEFEKIKVIPPVGSEEMARLLREHHIYITASKHESCSNSLIEALTCGLPVVYVKSGSNGEIAQQGGEGFETNEEALAAIDKIAGAYEKYAAILPQRKISDVADNYLSAMGVVVKP
ncbi:MAG: glycosyltransferase family 4 protein [Nitrospinae bacterium]|nr:glycosyltransferase family 4 protein [Nitrospinota bacterium]